MSIFFETFRHHQFQYQRLARQGRKSGKDDSHGNPGNGRHPGGSALQHGPGDGREENPSSAGLTSCAPRSRTGSTRPNWPCPKNARIWRGRPLLEKAAIQSRVEATEADLFKLDETLDKLDGEIQQLQEKLNDARARQKTIVMRTRATSTRRDVRKQLSNPAIDNAMDKFEYYERKIDQMEGQIDSDSVEQRGLQAEFDELAREENIDQELQNLKDRLTSK